MADIEGKKATPTAVDNGDNGVVDSEKGFTGEDVNLNSNQEARIKNPLAGIPKDVLLRQVEEFAQDKGMVEQLDLLKKGALVAQHPARFEEVEGITEEEKTALTKEVTHKWHQPTAMYFTVILCSIGACVQGWDQTGSNGANLSFPIAFDINDAEYLDEEQTVRNPDYTHNLWLVGLINGAPYLASAFLGCWLSDPLNNYFGRRGCIFFSAIFCLIPVIGSGVTQTWYQLFVTRLLLGIGMGSKASTVPIYSAENVPAAVRGGLVMSWQMWTAFGIFLGFAANLAVRDTGDIAWRLQFGSAFIPAVPLVIGVYFCPESPRWYMKKGRYANAYKSLLRLRNTPLQAARDLYYVHAQLLEEAHIIGQSTYVTRFIELFTIPRVRRATLASFTVMIAQQMCGINIIAFYSSTVFQQAGASADNALVASFGFGLVNFVFAFPAVWTIDTFGRRSLLLFTFPNMAWTLLACGLCFLIPESSKAHLGLVAMFIYLFAAFYSPGEGPVPFTYSAEVFPLSHREVGMSWAVATCLFWAFVLGLTWPRMVAAMTPTGAFGFYAGLNVTAFVMIFFWVPETKQRTLEELDYVFAVPTLKHMQYHVRHSIPYFIQRWIFFNKSAKLPPLYQFDEDLAEMQARSKSVTSETEHRHGSISEFIHRRSGSISRDTPEAVATDTKTEEAKTDTDTDVRTDAKS